MFAIFMESKGKFFMFRGVFLHPKVMSLMRIKTGPIVLFYRLKKKKGSNWQEDPGWTQPIKIDSTYR